MSDVTSIIYQAHCPPRCRHACESSLLLSNYALRRGELDLPGSTNRPMREEDVSKGFSKGMFQCPVRRAPPPWDHPDGVV
jgi:hypothetical protein